MARNVIVVILIILAFVAGYYVGKENQPMKRTIEPPVQATLTIQQDNSCQQSTTNGGNTPFVSVSLSGQQGVIWTGQNAATRIQVTFATSGAAGPFRTGTFAQNSPTGAPTATGSFPFSSVTINGVQCSNPQSMGVHITG